MPQPWTGDPILQTYRFCNVRRRDDRVSRWLIEHMLLSHAVHDTFTFVQWVSLGRWVNWPPTLEAIFDAGYVKPHSIDLPAAGKLIDSRQRSGDKVWTGAYMIRAPKNGMPKGQFICENVVAGLLEHKEAIEAAVVLRKCEEVWSALMRAMNFGPFMAGQVVADLTYTPMLRNASDLYTWAPQGPGSRRGYNRLMGLPLKHPAPSQTIWNHALQDWRAKVLEVIGGDPKTFTLHDMQNCLCEFDKYMRVVKGEGRPRSTYEPETAY